MKTADELYAQDVHICVKKRTGRVWYSYDSGCCHTSNTYGITIYGNDVKKLTERYPDYEFAIRPYEPRKASPFKLP